MNNTELQSIQCVKDLCVTITFSLKFSQHRKYAAGKANRVMSFTNKNFSFENKI